MNTEKIKAFKQLYVATHQLVLTLEQPLQPKETIDKTITQAIENVDRLIGMLPMDFPVMPLHYKGNGFLPLKDRIWENGYNYFRVEGEHGLTAIEDAHVLLINLEDGDDEPTVKLKLNNSNYAEYTIQKTTTFFYEITALTMLQHWKFTILNRVVELFTDPAMRKKYLPLALDQAMYCISKFPFKDDPYNSADRLYTSYHSHIGWYAYLTEDDPEKLAQALLTMEKGCKIGGYLNSDKHFEDTRSLLLFKLGRATEAYWYVRKMFEADPDYPVFLHLKTDTHYLTWLQEEENKEKEARQERQKAYQEFQQFVKEEQDKVTNQFENPEHPLVIQNAAILNTIKQCMVRIKYNRLEYKTNDPESFKNKYLLNKCSIQQLEQFEKEHGLHLPNELKVYLMEIGEGGTHYFGCDGVYLYKLAGVLLLQKPVIQEPCLYLGRSWNGDQLYIISTGAHEGEVWVHTQEDGGSRDLFDRASPQQFTFLSFMAESLLTTEQPYKTYPYKGAWM